MHSLRAPRGSGGAVLFPLWATRRGTGQHDPAIIHSPFTLVGVALLVGTAAGAYRSARRLGTRFLLGGAVGSVMVGLAAGLCHILLAGLFAFKVSGIQVGAATGRAFLMAFLTAAVGSFMGYLLAQYAPDASNVLTSYWRWSHRLRGWARTVADAFMVYGVVFTIIGLAGFVGYVLTTGNVWMLALVPLLFPLIPIILVVESSLGATLVTSGTSGQSTLSILTAQNAGTRAILWICLLVFLAATVLVGLRAAARNIYDPAHARWTDLWKAPATVGLGWLATAFLLARFSAAVTASGALPQLSSLSDSLLGTSTGSMLNASVSMSPSPWYVLVAASWMLLVEAMGLGFGRNLVVTWTPLWNAIRGGTVSPTPDDVQRHVRANGAVVALRGGRADKQGDTASVREIPDYASPFYRSSAQVGFPTTIPPLDRTQRRAVVAVAVLLAAATLLIVAMAFMGL